MKAKPMALALAYSVFAVGNAAWAGPIVEKATEAEGLLEAGNAPAALDRLQEAMEIAWDASPLIVRKALFVESSSGYGLYVERSAASTFKPGEKLLVYVEPAGYGYGRSAVGGLTIGFDVDFELKDLNGKTLFSKDEFLAIGSPVRYRNREFYLNMTVNLTGLKPGNYVSEFRLRDQNSDKTADFQLRFSVAE